MLTNVFSRSSLAHNINVGLTGDILSSIQPILPTEGSLLSTKFEQYFKAMGSEGFCKTPPEAHRGAPIKDRFLWVNKASLVTSHIPKCFCAVVFIIAQD